MKTALAVLLALTVVLIPFRVRAAQNSQRVAVPSGSQQGFRLNEGGVPSGYMILGDTDVAPPGYTYTGVSLYVESGTPGLPTWSTISPMLVPRAELAAAAVNGKVYAIGGWNGQYLASVEEYSPETETWSYRTPMLTARKEMEAAVVGQTVYVFGGSNGSYLDTVEAYDPATDSWSARAPMPTPRDRLTSAVVSGKVLVFGGYQGQALSVVEEYDPATDTWEIKPPMPAVDSEAAAAVVNGLVYVIGGDNGLQSNQTMFVYDPSTETWSTRSGPGMYDHAVALLGGTLYSFGGTYGGTFAFNAQVTAWSNFDPMPTQRSTLAAAVIGNSAYLLGGFATGPTAVAEVLSAPRGLYAHRKN